ncbi:MAG: 16S rRNA (uracil(1498)-N(3))-methyltransferase, partial [Bdellovibrionales bacterium]|nr:16S rRNA (uracil(1498)-N(3))-methyltransferase [Bdellovibrionales bacterium]
MVRLHGKKNSQRQNGKDISFGKMRRFWIDQDFLKKETLSISGDLLHHIRDVCRQEVGSHFELLPGDGHAYFVEVVSIGKKSLEVRKLEVRKIPEPSRPWIHLLLSVPKFATFESTLEKMCELGVAEVTPIFSDFSFIKGSDKLSESRWQRWQKIIVSASQQSGRGHLLKLHPAVSLKESLKDFNPRPSDLGLFLYEGDARRSLKTYLEDVGSSKDSPLEKVWVYVGSEGGFSPAEVGRFNEKGLPSLTLGDQVLRVETACVAIASIIKYHFESI